MCHCDIFVISKYQKSTKYNNFALQAFESELIKLIKTWTIANYLIDK